MTADIGPGDWVECIDNHGTAYVAVGSVWMVEEVGTRSFFIEKEVPCLILKGLVSSRGHRWVRAAAFRPVYRPKSEIIDGLKAPSPELEAA